MIQIDCRGEVKDNEITIFDRHRMKLLLKELEGKDIEIIIREKMPQRSVQQNKYYWKVVVERIQLAILELNGQNFSKEDIHDFLKNRFNATSVMNELTGEEIKIPKSTTKLDVLDFIVYVDSCKEFARDFLNLDLDKGDL
jgi:hypothetical protein